MDVKKRKLNGAQIVALGFVGLILAGAVLLYLPISSAAGETTPFVDALFTATTSVCVTGLVTVTTAVHWSLFGKIVILILIQFGGLGVIAVSVLSLLILGRRISIKNRRLIQETYNLDHLSGVVRMIRKITVCTLGAEAVGAVLYSFWFIPQFGPVKGIEIAVFNAVSAFCNAGMDIIGETSLESYAVNPLINFTTMGLIVAGGLGFTVWWDLAKVFKMAKRKEIPYSRCWKRLELHSKMAIFITAVLLAAGMVVFLAAEFNNRGTIGDMTLPEKVMASLFQSVTTRTAGFATVNQGALTDTSVSMSVILMFIGGSPLGTAGGMKTTTFGILILVVLAYLRGKKDTEAFNRRFTEENVRTAIVVVIVGFLALTISINLLCVFTDFDYLDLLFEATSAIGTVGLTRGITPQLNTAAKIVIIITMYLGRIGPITMATAITIRAKSKSAQIHKPECRILIG